MSPPHFHQQLIVVLIFSNMLAHLNFVLKLDIYQQPKTTTLHQLKFYELVHLQKLKFWLIEFIDIGPLKIKLDY